MKKSKTILLKSLFMGLLGGLPPFLMAADAEVRLTSIAVKSNGVSVAWESAADGFVFTLQKRGSQTGESWVDVPTRYGWPGVMTRWTEPGTPAQGAAFYRVIAEPIQTPNRGNLLSSSIIEGYVSDTNVEQNLWRSGISAEDLPFGVKSYKIVYETVDAYGLPTIASGALFVPQGAPPSLPLLSWQHGSQFNKNLVASRRQIQSSEYFQGLYFAASGYLTVVPDYVGMGDSPGFHPYMHAKSEATAVVDMLRAARTFCAAQGLYLNSQLFLAGYSQGGHATMAAHREIESHHADEFTVTASAPMAGPYDMSGGLRDVVVDPEYGPAYVTFLFAAWLPIYDLADTLEDLFRSPYDETLPPLLDGFHTYDQLVPVAPPLPDLLHEEYVLGIRNDTNHIFNVAARENDLFDWTPQAPVRMYQCAGDTTVVYEHAVRALEQFTANGACCVELVDPAAPAVLDHGPCFGLSIYWAQKWFGTFR